MDVHIHTRTRSTLATVIFAALTVVGLLLPAALPAMAQAQEETPTTEAQKQEAAPVEEETPTPEAQKQEAAPVQEETPTPEAQKQEPAPVEEETPTPEAQKQEPAQAQEETPTPEAQKQEPAQAQEETPTPDAQKQEPAQAQEETPTPDAQKQEPAPVEEETPTPDAQKQEPAPVQEETPASDTQSEEPAPVQEETSPSDAQNEDPPPAQEETPAPDTQNEDPPPAEEETKTLLSELSFSQAAWSADETDADGALSITVNINPALTEASAVNITTSPNAAGDARVPSTLALPAGQTSVALPITISGDGDAEGDESFDIELSAIPDAPYALGEPARTTITIIDDDRLDVQKQETAPTQEKTPTPEAQNQETAPTQDATPTPEAQKQEPAPAQEETSTPDTQNEDSPPAQEETPTPEAQNQETAPAQEETPASDTQNEDSPPAEEETETLLSELSFSQTAWSADETDADEALNITVNINPALTEASAVNITTSPNAAGDARVPSTLALPAGQTSVALPITISGDDDAESDESFDVELSPIPDAPYVLGEPARTAITISDDDRPELTIVEAASAQGAAAAPQKEAESPSNASQFQSDTQVETPQYQQNDGANSDPAPQSKLRLSQAAWSADEADGTLEITVNISPALPEASEVNILTRYNGAATAADVSVPATLALPAGQTSATLRIDITDDSLVEGDESFRIVLSASDNAPYKLASRRRRRATITINDDDFATLAFEQDAYPANEWGRTLTIPVKINPAMANASAVNITTRHISTAATDVSVPSTLTLPAGQTRVDLPITIHEDALVEGAESFAIELSASAGAPYTLGERATTTITITDNDRPSLSIDSPREVMLHERDADFTHNFTVKIKPALPVTSTVGIVVEWNDDGRVRAPATLTLPQGAASVKLPLTVIGDDVHKGSDRVRVKLSAVAGAPYKLHDMNALHGVRIWIIDDDSSSSVLSFGATNFTVSETDGEVTKKITVRLSNHSLYHAPRGYKITTRYGSATAADVTVPATFDLPAKGYDVKVTPIDDYSFPITIHGDDIVEGPESFEIELSAVAGARYQMGRPVTATITINDDEFAALALGQAAYTVNEGAGTLTIPVKISPAMANASAVNITTRYDSAAAADVSAPATLTLPAGQTSVDLQIPITADSDVEHDETFTVTLSAVADAPYKLGAQAAATITIQDDDSAALAFSQAAWSVTEADTDGALNVNVSISPALPVTGTVNITTRHISTAAADLSVPATLTLPAGQTSVDLPITIRGDDTIEGAEKFEIELSAAAGARYTLGAPAKTAITINDDDFAALTLGQAAWSVTEGDTDGTLNVKVSVSPALPVTGTVNITTRYDSAAAADVSVPETLTLPAGQTSVDLPITIRGDSAVEGVEKLEIELAAVAGAPYKLGAQATATITINDDDFATLALGNADSTVDESAQQRLGLDEPDYTINEGGGALTIPVSISSALPVTGTVNITTRHISTAAADVSVPATLTLPQGATSASLRIPITDDTDVEGAETFEIELVAVADALYTLGAQAKATITINDDDLATLAFSQAAWSVNEGDGALNITIDISPALPTDSAVNITTRHISTAAADVSVPATLTLPKDATSVTLRVDTTDDTDVEGDETFTVALSASGNEVYTLGQPVTATITIKDNDQSLAASVVDSNAPWTIAVAPGDQKLEVSWQAPPGVKAGDIFAYRVTWCLEVEGWGCNPTTRLVYPAADGSGSYTITRHFSPGSDPSMAPLINGARYRVYVRAMQGYNTSLARSESSYNNRPQPPGIDSEH